MRRNIDWFDRHLPVSPQSSLDVVSARRPDVATKVFNLQGICIGEYADEAEAVSGLGKGIYIINGKKTVVK